MSNFKVNSEKYDLENRTAEFGEKIIDLCRRLTKDIISEQIVKQLVRSSTSVGANYMEANGASSRKDFVNKIHICKKESQESKHWLRMLARSADNKHKEEIRLLWDEAQQLSMIFSKICSSAKIKK